MHHILSYHFPLIRVMVIHEITKMLKLLLLFNLYSSLLASFLIDYPSTKMITINATGAYFGYSILLQKGNPPIAIVGAPRQKHGKENTGSVLKCDLNSLRCDEFNRISRVKGIYPKGRTGDFLGVTLDGDDNAGGKFFTCAPRFIIHESNRGDYFTNGRCFYIKDSTNVDESARLLLPLNTERQVSNIQRIIHYDAAYGEAGLDIAYSKDENILVIGAPGKSLWNGAIVKTNIISYRNDVFSFAQNSLKYQDVYFGYAVTWGKFIKSSQMVWYAVGAPRGVDLKGMVYLYDVNIRTTVRQVFRGEEFGSYFGASLLVIHNTNVGDDLLIGAPMYAGNSWDEGCVYYYKNLGSGTFYPPVKLVNKKTSSRFGTAMAAIGDIDLDSFADCAISAPYEDDGIGAVYLYFGTKAGFGNDKFHRISPSHFSSNYPRTVIRGFGMGLSNGNDIDNNKHNDLVIGAYQSGQIFSFKTKEIFDVSVNLTSNMKIIYTSTPQFSLTYCISFKFRNGHNEQRLEIISSLVLEDERILNKHNVTKKLNMNGNDVHCMSETVFLKKDHLNIEPLLIPYGYRLNESKDLTEQIFHLPVSYECGTDNVCQTNLRIYSTALDTSQIIFGVNSEVKVNVTIANSGESAYQTKLYFKVSPEISLINLRECDFENGSYVCLVAQVLNGKVEKSFLFDLANIEPSWTSIPINLRVDSIGKDVDSSDNEVNIEVPVILQNNPHIDSRTVPESVFLNKSEDDIKISHVFVVGNYGPSPLGLNLTILVSQVDLNGSSVVEIKSVEGSVNEVASKCSISMESVDINVASLRKVQKINDTKIMSCLESLRNCTAIVCSGDYLPKSNKNAVFTVKLTVNISPTVEFMGNANKMLLISSAYFTNGTHEFFTSASTLLLTIYENNNIPLWIYIVSVISGMILLLLVILTLYKCNFFKRTYKEMMEHEKLYPNKDESEQPNDDSDVFAD